MDNALQAVYQAVEHKRRTKSVRRLLGYTEAQIQADPALCGKIDPDKAQIMAMRCLAKVMSGKWKPRPYRHIRRKSPTNGKVREIDCPTLEDHIIHWMLIRAIKSVILRGMVENSCGSVKGRGNEYGRKKLERWARREDAVYYVKLDVRKFYHSIPHDRLKADFRKIIKDKRVLALIDAVIDSLPEGLAIGNYTSQWFGNFYLQDVDHYIQEGLYKERRGKRVKWVRHYLRNMDDMILIGTSKRDLDKAVREVIRYLREEKGLEVKPAWEIKRFDEAALDALGYRFDGKVVTVRKIIFLRTKRKAARIARSERRGEGISVWAAQGLASSLGWFVHAAHRHFVKLYILPYVDMEKIKEVIRHESKKQRIAAVPCIG